MTAKKDNTISRGEGGTPHLACGVHGLASAVRAESLARRAAAVLRAPTLADRIEGLCLAGARRAGRMARAHDRVRAKAERIYTAALGSWLDKWEAKLLAAVKAGYSPVTASDRVRCGDLPGHEFRGNQWTGEGKTVLTNEERQHVADSGQFLHGTSSKFEVFKYGGHKAVYLSDPSRDSRRVTQAEHIASGPFGGNLVRVEVDDSKLKKFDHWNDPVAKKIFEDTRTNKDTKFIDYTDMPAIVAASAKHGYNDFTVYEPSVQGFSRAITNMDALKIVKESPVKVRASGMDLVRASANVLTFDLDGFTEDFMASMREAGAEAYKVTSRGLLAELGASERETDDGVVRDFLVRRENKLSGCPGEVYAGIRADLKEGVDGGETMDELADRVKANFDGITRRRAELIAQTETQCVYGTAQNEALGLAGFTTKRWVTMDDEKVRESHQECEDAGAVPSDEPFPNGLMFPGDPDGEASEVCRCRCYLAPGDEDEGLGDEGGDE